MASLLHRHWGDRGERVGILILDFTVGHTLVEIVVADPTRRDLVERAARHDSSLPQMRSEGRKPTIGITQQGRNSCPLLLRRQCIV